MTMKLGELAKKLEMSSNELIEKATSMGIEAKTTNSSLTDIDAKTLENSILAKRRKEAETRIVRVAPQHNGGDEDQEPKVTVKAAKILPKTNTSKPKTAPARPQSGRDETKSRTARPPIGTPMAKSATSAAEGKPPIGKPMPKREVKSSEDQPTTKVAPGVPLTKAETKTEPKTEPKVEQPVEAKEQPKVETTPEVKSQPKEEPKVETKAAQPKVEVAPEPKREAIPEKPKAQEINVVVKAQPNRPKTTRPAEPRKSATAQPKPQMTAQKREENRKSESRGTARPTTNRKPATNDNTKAQGAGDNKPVRRPQRSLEKKARKKYVKPKTDIVPEIEEAPLPVGTKVVNVPITIAGFCEQTGVSVANVILTLLKMGVVANQNQNIDEVTVATLADEMGIQVVIGTVEEEEVEEGIETFEDREKDLLPRSPIITVMGHVDHGKTSLLDAIRKTNVATGESGGITQHIGASEVMVNGEKIVFLDTPGHEAFTAMRARGADITDIAILVVAADDSVKPQTIESISHAKAAGVPIIVAVNKIDKPGANPDKVKQDLTEHGVIVEEYGGDVICVPVSAKTGEGIQNLFEMILIQAEVLELKANPNRHAMGTVIEARLDKSKGPVASLLVTNGTLKTGQSIVAGTSSGRIRLMTNHLGETIRKAGPATAVEVLGLSEAPAAGDRFNAVGEDKLAKSIAEKRKMKQREEVMARTSGSSLEELFSQMEEGEAKELNLIIKADVRGSIGAIIGSLENLSNKEVKVRMIHSGVGAITESDISLAATSGAIVIGFNVRPSAVVSSMAEREGVQIRTYRVIYNIIDDIEAAMKGMLDPEFKEEVLGQVEVRDTFKVPGVGIIAGAYVTSGKIVRNNQVRLIRDGIVIHEGSISSLKRFKDDAKEVNHGYECGVGIAGYNDLKEGDIIECFHMVEIERA